MNYDTARKILLDQAIATEEHPDTLLLRMQQGKPAVPGQITSILLALKVVFEGLKEANTIDRQLAHALYLLTIKTQQLFTIGRKNGIDWPPLFKEDLLRIGTACESIFSGVWQNVN
ncbi:Dethiobiotin synthetase [Brunnivagina elsteri]|uniref:Dethiobiotin synthetase n=1 Tax=Brunnivagina elsteri CCALA 953 TaxID=987040 RepID=A0A2A2TQV8_9CYAN|nr:Dethiobiotin synthetase [Calothrix elsteri]PAX60528.1 Dethiobiotin synthetase [Calothrix elsteri CCALA 953]